MFDFNCSDGGNPGLTELSLVPLPAVPVETSLPFTGHFASEPMTSLVLLDDDNDYPKASASVRKPKEKNTTSRRSTNRKTPKVSSRTFPKSKRRVKKGQTQKRSKGSSSKPPRKPKTRSGLEKPTEIDESYSKELYKRTALEGCFHWPRAMIDQVCSGHAKGKHVHIQLSTEFSGAGTAEFAAKALCESSNGKLSCQVLGCADWASNSKHALIKNCDASTHVFGDIAGVCPSEMMTKANRKIAVTVTLLNFGVFVCSNDFQCNY